MKIARTATPGTGFQFRKDKYGSSGIRSFLRDVLAMANAAVDGPRYIIIGADLDSRGRKAVHAVDAEDFSGKPSYQSLANEYIEPPLRIRYKPVNIDGHRVGVFEIGDSQDRPYMMRIDYSETLRRGDAYIRNNSNTMKMGRRQLAELFERKFRDSVSADDPYVDRTPEELLQEMSDLRVKYRDQDNHFLFESRAERVQMVAYNQGEEPIIDASLSLIMPNHNAFYVADTLPRAPRDRGFSDRTPDEIAAYPSVSLKDDSVQVTSKIGDIPVGEPVDVFVSPLRLCVGKDLCGNRFGVRYALHGQNLRSPAKGILRLLFR